MMIPSYNYINIGTDQLDTPIYRVMSVDRLLYMLESKKLTLRRPHLWEDPFENILRRTIIRSKNRTDFDFENLMNCFYGQCWTFEKESDAMWRIYAPCKQGIKIKTTICKLLSAIFDKVEINPDRKCFIGKVVYKSDNEITDILRKITSLDFITDRDFLSQARTLLIKPNAYKYEEEIRLIYRSDSTLHENEQFFTINPNDLFDEVVFDSRIGENMFKIYSEKLSSLNYIGIVGQSKLYFPIQYIINKNDLCS